jgi:hypothetical protein
VPAPNAVRRYVQRGGLVTASDRGSPTKGARAACREGAQAGSQRAGPRGVYPPGHGRHDEAFSGGATTLMGLLRLAGKAELAAKVRPSSRRPGQTASEAGDETPPAPPEK